MKNSILSHRAYNQLTLGFGGYTLFIRINIQAKEIRQVHAMSYDDQLRMKFIEYEL